MNEYTEIFRAEEYNQTITKVDILNSASGGTFVIDSVPARKAVEDIVKGIWKPINMAEIQEQWIDKSNEQRAYQTIHCGPICGQYDTQEVDDKDKTWKYLAQQMAEAKLIKMRDNLLSIIIATVDNVDSHIIDVSRGYPSGRKTTCSMSHINQMLATMGDARDQIASFVMPSAVFNDLVGNTIAPYAYDRVAGITVYQDVVQAFGRAVLVVDSPALIEYKDEGYNEYTVIGLGVGAAAAIVDREQCCTVQLDHLLRSEIVYIDEDSDIEYEIFGMKHKDFDKNLSDKELMNSSNWLKNYDDHRQFRIVKGVFNSSDEK